MTTTRRELIILAFVALGVGLMLAGTYRVGQFIQGQASTQCNEVTWQPDWNYDHNTWYDPIGQVRGFANAEDSTIFDSPNCPKLHWNQ